MLGEFRRTLDERSRLSIPLELAQRLTSTSTRCVLAKERPGALSLWQHDPWQKHLADGLDWVSNKLEAGKWDNRSTTSSS